ncbi:DEAD/DEAH box helicase [archaeon]|nr:DEAD/DEAH box helicase [archaeon]
MVNIEQLVLSANNFLDFNEVQKKALKKHWNSKNLVISSPTASGKTIIAELCALNSILEKKRKVVYTCPLRALASEHFNDWKAKYSKGQKIRMALSTGDFDSSSNYLQNYDLIFTTFEKLDSLLRHNAEWLSSIGLLIIDEIHELDSERGPCIEMVASKLRQLNPKVQILALSATIPNSRQIAKWLNAELVESNYRPVKLKEGVYFNEAIHFAKEREGLKSSQKVLKKD